VNTNPLAKRIVCYGDSYTWGYQPLTNHLRYDADTRWTGVLQTLLGNDYEIIEEGLNSRTLISEDTRPDKQGRDGALYLLPCLDTHDPIDLVILMLGTNELKETYSKQAKEIADIIYENFIQVISSRKSQFADKYPKVLVIAPPIVNDKTEYAQKRLYNSDKSRGLVKELKSVCKASNIYFIDSNVFVKVGDDGVHFDDSSHKKLAEGIYNHINLNIFHK